MLIKPDTSPEVFQDAIAPLVSLHQMLKVLVSLRSHRDKWYTSTIGEGRLRLDFIVFLQIPYVFPSYPLCQVERIWPVSCIFTNGKLQL